jgi:hypothetical protein
VPEPFDFVEGHAVAALRAACADAAAHVRMCASLALLRAALACPAPTTQQNSWPPLAKRERGEMQSVDAPQLLVAAAHQGAAGERTGPRAAATGGGSRGLREGGESPRVMTTERGNGA